MIGYIQRDTCKHWSSQVAKGITELSESGQVGRSVDDLLQTEAEDIARRTAILSSRHQREGGLTQIELRHLWVEMH